MYEVFVVFYANEANAIAHLSGSDIGSAARLESIMSWWVRPLATWGRAPSYATTVLYSIRINIMLIIFYSNCTTINIIYTTVNCFYCFTISSKVLNVVWDQGRSYHRGKGAIAPPPPIGFAPHQTFGKLKFTIEKLNNRMVIN